jgi:membrane fusion protein (multidrug efflux system)
MQVPAGYYMLSVIPLDQIWINANFKETQAGRMAIGQKAKVTSDIYGGRITYHGRIVGLPGAGGNAFSILPPQNLSGNWIKIVQRLPIRIVLDPEEIKKFPLRLGLSMEATVDLTSDTEGYEPVVPHYDTAIFKEEEAEAEESSLAIFGQNIDPILAHYVDSPLELRTLLALDEEAFFSP